MNADQNKTSSKWKGLALAGVLALAGLGIAGRAVDTGKLAFASDAATQTTFHSPADAAAALAQAAKSSDEGALTKVLGREAQALITSGNSESDKAAMQQFFSKYQQMNRWVDMTDGSRVLYIGGDNFAFPVPLAKNSSGQWYFDAVAGAEEVRARDIGRNELLAIDACSALAKAQEVYFNTGDAREYARHVVSTPGKHDGLYWPAPQTQASSPLGQLSQFPKSSFASSPAVDPLVIDGYTLRILTAQGDEAPGGAKNYLVNGKMTEDSLSSQRPSSTARPGS